MKAPLHEPEFVSRQVAEAKRYYVNLNPGKKRSFTVVCGGVERMQKEYVVQRESFPYCAIELVTEGAGSLFLEGNGFDLVPGTVFAYGPSTRHRIENKPPKRMRKYYVDFWGSQAEATLRELGLLNTAPLHATRPYELIEIFEWLDREARCNGGRTEPMCQALLILLFEKIRQLCVPHQTSALRSFETYERIREHLDRHFLQISTIEELAHQCKLTPVHTSRLFRQFAGVSPYRVLLRLKMSYAAELMSRENLLVKDVAERLGFRDPFQFSRAFKSIYGVSPRHLIESQL